MTGGPVPFGKRIEILDGYWNREDVMKRFTIILYTIWSIVSLVTVDELRAVPQLLNYQGKISQHSAPLDDTVTMTFRIVSEASGGVILWEEKQTSVVITGGLYNVLLGTGETNSLYGSLDSAIFFSDDIWLEVDINGELLTPGQKFSSIAFSYRTGDVERVGGHSRTDLAAMDHFHAFNDLVGSATDAQIPDDLSVAHVDNVDLLGGSNSDSFAAGVHSHSGDDLTSGMLPADRVDNMLTTDLELAAGLAEKAETDHVHDSLYYTRQQVDSSFSALDARLTAVEEKLQNVSLSADAGDLTFSGVNIHINSGSGATYSTVNSLGNLIVGYNEERGTDDDRSGSHNVIVGIKHNYSSYGGLVAGYQNTLSGRYASVSGGRENVAGSESASVSGGYRNEALGVRSSISGGRLNRALQSYASVRGGYDNLAGALDSSISGGRFNAVAAEFATINGGQHNTASGWDSTVNGGEYNTVSIDYSSISGGRNNLSSGLAASVSGGGGAKAQDGNIAFADYASVLGGLNTLAGDGVLAYDDEVARDVYSPGKDHSIGFCSVAAGGKLNAIQTYFSSVSGGTDNVIATDDNSGGEYSSISGGTQNLIQSRSGSVSGGMLNKVTGEYSSVTGGYANNAAGTQTTVTGGADNMTDNALSVVSGGHHNTAESLSSISGGQDNYCTSSFSSISTISGGANNSIVGEKGSISGGYRNEISNGGNVYSSISGGYLNKLRYCKAAVVSGGSQAYFSSSTGEKDCADHTVISGGMGNSASGDFSSVSGGREGSVINGYKYSVISGGYFNETRFDYSSVHGGDQNRASALQATVSGGQNRETTAEKSWRAGTLFEPL